MGHRIAQDVQRTTGAAEPPLNTGVFTLMVLALSGVAAAGAGLGMIILHVALHFWGPL